jgi:hypothetical protein
MWKGQEWIAPKRKRKHKHSGTIMKTNLIVKAIVAAALLGVATTGLLAQNTDPVCPFGYEPGTGQAMTAEQRAKHVAALQALVQELRAKRDAETLTPEEQAWLQQVERRGGYLRTGTPRGQRGQAMGQGLRQGPRDGAGPRGGQGIGRGQGPRDGAALGGGRGFGHGPRDRARQAGGQGLRQGPRDGTGPRAIDGTCPQVNVR